MLIYIFSVDCIASFYDNMWCLSEFLLFCYSVFLILWLSYCYLSQHHSLRFFDFFKAILFYFLIFYKNIRTSSFYFSSLGYLVLMRCFVNFLIIVFIVLSLYFCLFCFWFVLNVNYKNEYLSLHLKMGAAIMYALSIETECAVSEERICCFNFITLYNCMVPFRSIGSLSI